MTPLITFEGGEGGGKSTQLTRIANRLRVEAIEVVETREPGGTPQGEGLRTLLTKGATDRWLPLSEVFLLSAARHEHVERVIRPALDANKWVLSDRFADSTMAYQGYGYGLPLIEVDHINRLAVGDIRPDITFVLDIDPIVGLGRAAESQRYEGMDLGFHQRLREGFLEIAARDEARCCVIDATKPVDQIEAMIATEISRRFGIAL